MSHQPRRRKVTVTISARDVNDPKAILDEVLKTLQGKKVEVTIAVDQTSIAEPAEPPPTSVPDEQLETEIKDTVEPRLEEENRQADAANPTCTPNPQTADAARRSIWKRVAALTARGWRITVYYALEWAAGKLRG